MHASELSGLAARYAPPAPAMDPPAADPHAGRGAWRPVAGPAPPSPRAGETGLQVAGRVLLLVGWILQILAALAMVLAFVVLGALGRGFDHRMPGMPFWFDGFPLPFVFTPLYFLVAFLFGAVAALLLFLAWRAATQGDLQRAGILGIVGGVMGVLLGMQGYVGLVGGILCLVAPPPGRATPTTAPAPTQSPP